MATNADEPEATDVQAEEVSTDLEAELREAKAEAEAKPQAEETEQVAQSTEPAEAEEAPAPEATLTTEPEHDLDWYKKAYEESTKEALRLKGELDKKVEAPVPEALAPAPTDEVLTPEQLYIRQKQNEEITDAFNDISVKYPQVKDPDTYNRFVAEANLVGRVIVESEKRYPSPKELYEKTAVILGLTQDNSDQVGAALKDSAAQPRTSSSTPAPTPRSKVTEEMISANMKMYPNKSRQEIIEELEPHIN